eukprot:240901-Prorocentrum_minimum.AAC.1
MTTQAKERRMAAALWTQPTLLETGGGEFLVPTAKLIQSSAKICASAEGRKCRAGGGRGKP